MHSTLTKSLPVIEQAIEYACNGFPVFPVNPHNKAPLTTNGFKDASTDPREIRGQWNWHPTAMIGIPTGATSGFWVLDLDKPKEGNPVDGVEAFTNLMCEHGSQLFPHVISPSGGQHYYFRYDRPMRNAENLAGLRIDLRGDGGYIVAGGSVKSFRERYTFEDPATRYVIQQAPGWLYEWIEQARNRKKPVERQPVQQQAALHQSANPFAREYGKAALASEADKLAGTPPGERHQQTRNSAISMATLVTAGVITTGEAKDALKDACNANGHIKDDGLRSVEQTIEDGLRYGEGLPPREIPAPSTGAGEEVSLTGIEVSLADLSKEEPPAREFIDSRWFIPMDAVSLITGDGGAGKSLVALQLAIAVATGGDWLGKTVQTGPVLYLSAEDDKNEINRRARFICGAEDVKMEELANVKILPLVGRSALFAKEARDGTLSPTKLLHEFEERVAKINPRLIVIDNRADVFGGNENNRNLAVQFIGLLRGIAQNGRGVVMLAHPSVTGLNDGTGRSGTTGWANSVRAVLYLEHLKNSDGEVTDKNRRTLTLKKANYAEPDRVINLQWEDGRFVAEKDTDQMSGQSKAERVFMSLLNLFTKQRRKVSSAKNQNAAYITFAEHPLSEGVTKNQFRQAMEVLLAAGKIENYEEDRHTYLRVRVSYEQAKNGEYKRERGGRATSPSPSRLQVPLLPL